MKTTHPAREKRRLSSFLAVVIGVSASGCGDDGKSLALSANSPAQQAHFHDHGPWQPGPEPGPIPGPWPDPLPDPDPIPGPIHDTDPLPSQNTPPRPTPKMPPAKHILPGPAAGSFAGRFSVDASGTAAYDIPIEVPRGRLGVQPSLSFAYRSSSGDGIMGRGFTLTGLTSITRCARTRVHDGEARAVELNGDDRFCLGDVRLVLAGPETSYADPSAEYRPEYDPTTRVEPIYERSETDGPAGFRVTQADGTTLVFGENRYGRIETPRTPRIVVEWLLQRVEDRLGNFYRVQYYRAPAAPSEPPEIHETFPHRISYTHFRNSAGEEEPGLFSIEFEYEDRPDISLGYRFGYLFRRSKRLVSTVTRAGDDVVRRYRVAYAEDALNSKSRVKQIQECAEVGEHTVCKKPMTFGWGRSHGNVQFPQRQAGATLVPRTVSNWQPLFGLASRGDTSALNVGAPNRFFSLDADGDGIKDIGYFNAEEAIYHEDGNYWTSRLMLRFGGRDASTALDTVYPTSTVLWGSDLVFDYDHDGKDDLLLFNSDSIVIARSTGANFEEIDSGLRYSRDWTKAGGPLPIPGAMAVADMNGDGRDDVLACGYVEDCSDTGDGLDLLRLTTALFTGALPLCFIDGVCTTEPNPQKLLTCRGRWYYSEATETGLSGWRDTGIASRCAFEKGARAGDFDGDGKSELFIGPAPRVGDTDTPGNGVRRLLRMNDGEFSATTTAVCVRSKYWSCDGENVDRVGGLGPIADVNGDGLHDLVLYGANQVDDLPAEHNWRRHERFAFGTGDKHVPFTRANRGGLGWETYENERTDILIGPLSPVGDGSLMRSFLQTPVLDLTGDGQADALQLSIPRTATLIRCLWEVGPGICLTWGWPQGQFHRSESTGSAFAPPLPEPGTFSPPVYLDTQDLFISRLQFVTADLNGDGTLDVAQMQEQDTLSVEHDTLATLTRGDVTVHWNYGGLPQHVTTISEGNGHWRTIAYSPLTDSSVYSRGDGCIYPVRCVRDARYVVSHVREDNGTQPLGLGSLSPDPKAATRWSYRYADGRTSLDGRGWLGFARRESRNLTSGEVAITEFDNQTRVGTHYPYAGLPKRQVATQQLPGPLGFDGQTATHTAQETVNTYRLAVYGTPPQLRAELQSQVTLSYEGRPTAAGDPAAPASYLSEVRRVTTTHDYEPSYGYRSLVSTNRGDGNLDITRIRYAHDEASWLLGQPVEVVTESITTNGGGLRRARIEYDAKGLTTKLTFAPGTANEVATHVRQRDRYGNPQLVETTSPGIDATVNELVYDNLGLFPIAHRNALGHVRYEVYEPGLSVPVRLTDPNHRTTSFYYDGFGRLVGAKDPETPAVSFSFSDIDGPIGALRVTMIQPGVAQHLVTYDRLGRVILDESLRMKNRWARSEQAYDALGRRARWSRPYFVGDEPVFMSATFDPLSRPLSVQTTPTTATEYSYEGRTVRIRNPRGVITALDFDAQGRKVRQQEPAPGGLTEFKYGAWDQLVEVVDAQQNKVSLFYDILGRQVGYHDEDSGHTGVTYDARNRVTSTTSADQQTRKFEYDLLDRLVLIRSPEGKTKFTHDPPYNLGKLDEASSPDNVRVSYLYDSAGRLAAQTHTISKSDQTTYFFYDNAGRPQLVAYPAVGEQTPFFVTYDYDANGFLEEIRGPSGTVFYGVSDMDAEGRITVEKRGTVKSVRTYSPTTGLLSKWKSSGVVAAPPQPAQYRTLKEHVFGYDENGNLVRDEDVVNNTISTYTYDALDRLSAVARGGALQQLSYDSIGNMTASPLGILQYGQTLEDGRRTHPHAVTNVSGQPYSYDVRGNLLNDGARTFEYTSTQLPKRVAKNGQTFELGYDPFGVRAFKRSKQQLALSHGPLAEDRSTVNGGSKRTYLVAGPQGIVAEVSEPLDGAQAERFVLMLDHDRLGSPTLAVHPSAVAFECSYDALGKQSSSMWPETVTNFTGHRADKELGVIDMRARLYDPKLGRFLSADPLRLPERGGQALNRYSYVWNNPLNAVDPSGLDGEESLSIDVYESGGRTIWRETVTRTDTNGVIHLPPVRFEGPPRSSMTGATAERPASQGVTSAGDAARQTAGEVQGSPRGYEPIDLADVYRRSQGTLEVADGFAKISAGIVGAGLAIAAAVEVGAVGAGTVIMRGVGTAALRATQAVAARAPATTNFAINAVDALFADAAGVSGTGAAGATTAALLHNCFAAGTPVLREDGLVPIEAIEVGDRVYARDSVSGEVALKVVTWVKEPEEKPVLAVTIAPSDGRHETLHVTPGHPFFVIGEGFVWAGALQVGHRLLSASGAIMQVQAVQQAGTAIVHNFSVDDWHTYHVGRSAVLVHNTSEWLQVTERLMAYADVAMFRFDEFGEALTLTERQYRRLAHVPGLRRAFRGQRLDTIIRGYARNDPVTRPFIPKSNRGPDARGNIDGVDYWWDFTTTRGWPSHVIRYLAYGPNGTLIPVD